MITVKDKTIYLAEDKPINVAVNREMKGAIDHIKVKLGQVKTDKNNLINLHGNPLKQIQDNELDIVWEADTQEYDGLIKTAMKEYINRVR